MDEHGKRNEPRGVRNDRSTIIKFTRLKASFRQVQNGISNVGYLYFSIANKKAHCASDPRPTSKYETRYPPAKRFFEPLFLCTPGSGYLVESMLLRPGLWEVQNPWGVGSYLLPEINYISRRLPCHLPSVRPGA